MSDHARARRPRGSIFVKLVAIMLVMAFSLLLMVASFFRFVVSPNLGASVDRMFVEYTRAVALTSPDLAAARRLAPGLDMRIRYEGPAGSWATDEGLPSIDETRRRLRRSGARASLGSSRSLVQAADGGTYLFSWEMGRRMDVVHDQLLALLLLLMVGVVFTAHVVLRRALRPLRWLHEGVARLSEGDLDVVLEKPTRDELGALTEAFNQMVGRVRQMVRARDQLLLDVSHELRSPLTRMKVALALLPDGEKKERMAADVSEMEAMIGELLELERLREGRGLTIEPHDLAPVLREVAQGFRDVRPGVRIVSLPAELRLAFDADRIRSVLRNLFENATKYSLPDSRPVEVSAGRDGDALVVRVSDDGPGIPEGDLANLFEPFFRVDRSRSKRTGGYGLGLSICKRVMEAHGGAISASNNAGRGASFTLRFRQPD